MVEESSQVKQLSLNHECKIGLTVNIRNHRETLLNGHRRSGLELDLGDKATQHIKRQFAAVIMQADT